MPTRATRLDKFITKAAPESDSLVELLCEDHIGTYLLPFLCRNTAEGFRNTITGELIQVRVVGWREPMRLDRQQNAVPDDKSRCLTKSVLSVD